MRAIYQHLCCTILFVLIQRSKGGVQRRETFEGGNYLVEWEADFEDQKITFNVSVATNGFVGFGISHIAGMTGADIIIGGVRPNGDTYFDDYHAIGNQEPILDLVQDWNLIEASESGGWTNLQFSRLLETCDEDDVVITVVWSYGLTDDIKYHGGHRGAISSNILDPPPPPINMTGIDTWTIPRKMTMPAEDTSYWCTIHRQPKFESDQFIVGFSVFPNGTEAWKHSHHATIFKCTAPEGQDPETFFEPFVGHPGGDCYDPLTVMPRGNCMKILYVWAIGGSATIFPENVGYRISAGSNPAEYWMYEIHYDNPDKLSGVEFETSVEIYHTGEPRNYEAELLNIMHSFLPTHLIPPHSKDFVTVGHCSPQCTDKKLPPDGINVFNVLLHSHLAGRKLTIRQFRNGMELPWLSNDHHYNFNYQQTRPLREFAKILPGDQLNYECVTDTTDRNYATLAGLSTRHEMCEKLLWYYPKQDFTLCGSYYDDLYNFFGTFNVTDANWALDPYDPTVLAPPEHAGKLFSQVASEFPWTQASRDEMQNELRFRPHGTLCFGTDYSNNTETDHVGYPDIDEPYVPPSRCFPTRLPGNYEATLRVC